MEILLDSLNLCLLLCYKFLCHVVFTTLDCVAVIVKAGKWTHIVLCLHVGREVTLSEEQIFEPGKQLLPACVLQSHQVLLMFSQGR